MRRWWMTLLVVGCSGNGGGCGNGGGKESELVFDDSNNYTFAGDIEFGTVTLVAPGDQDVTIDWSDVETDLRKRPLDPADVETVAFAFFELSPEELDAAVENNTANTEDYFDYSPDGNTSAMLVDFDVEGQPLDQAALIVPKSGTFAVSLLDVNQTALMSVLVDVVDGDPPASQTIALDSESSSFTVLEAAFATPVTVQAGAKSYPADWSAVTTDAYGNPFVAGDVGSATIAHYDGTVADIEADFLNLDVAATDLWTLAGTATSVELTNAIDVTGAKFPGFTAGGTWLVYLSCGLCQNPAPLALFVVEVEE